uniref:Zinc finger protein 532 n=1 Tax=Esox lucius TaxID=8010 RepID=A0A6Q2Z750_ESOLU
MYPHPIEVIESWFLNHHTKIMGDMKTPDFDDLLAAFDIPDMVDPKAAIESGHEEPHEGQLKHPSIPHEDEEQLPSGTPDVGVSVIVKNVHKMDANGDTEKEVQAHPTTIGNHNRLHNGFLSSKTLKAAETHHALAISSHSTFNQFSPISSAEEFDDDDKIEVDDPLDRVKQCSLPCFRTNPLTGLPATTKKDEQQTQKSILVEPHSTTMPGTNGASDRSKLDKNNNNNNTLGTSNPNLFDSPKPAKEASRPQEGLRNEAGDPCSQSVSSSFSQAKQAKSSAKLSSCIAAIAALSAKKATTADTTHSVVSESLPTTQRNSLTTLPNKRESRESPKDTRQRESPRVPLVDKLLSKHPESPSSPATSEGSSRGSRSPSYPSASSPSIPVIPKVRIKTIKTSSGQIKRTVTRVLPQLAQSELDPEGPKRGDLVSVSAASIMVSSLLSSPTSLRPSSLPTTGGTAMEIAKQMTIKPVATAFLPVSAVKTAGTQVINLKLANNTTVKATVIPAASVQSASNAILKAANAIHQQQQTVMVPASSLANAKFTVPKTVHLTNFNLLQQTKTTSVSELHQVWTQGQQPVKQALLATQVQAQKKGVSRVQVLASSQSSVVEAFNKVLSSINPVPVYVPNLSPPSSACISLPSRGYRCLECGDSFALERSLTQHYDRRSVRIEVTCNHCAKNLVFYNKCSLLSHARGHKDKGVVMQCSHLILKPIPADQMITTSPPVSSTTITNNTSTGFTHSSTSQQPVKGIGTQAQAAVICAPSNAPPVAAMPLDEDTSRLCRTSLKCLECSEMFQDENSLAIHYQQASESSGQKTCTICQMLLPNGCSFASHQRIHQHKSPYICPECGAICRSVHFQSHVTRNCLHYTRRVGYRCVHCSVIYADVTALKTHIQSSHCEIFYKCPICPMAFKSAPGTQSHGYTQHPGVKIGEPKLIYKCSMCDTVFTQQTLLQSHFDQHIANHKVSVFKCPDCSMHYAQKQLMLDHIKAMHGTLKTIEGPPNLGINLPLSTKPTNPMSSSPNTNIPKTVNGLNWGDKKTSSTPLKKAQNTTTSASKKPPAPGWTCEDCDRLFTQREVFVAHMRREHGKQLKKHPCRQCDKSFSSSHSLCRHNRIKHKGLRKVYFCPHCPDHNRTFTKRIMLDKHIQLMHGGIKDPEGKVAPDSTNTEKTPPVKALSPKRKQQDEEGPPVPCSKGSTPTQPLKKLKVHVFKVHKCAVCCFTTEDLVTFHDHIPQHKSNGSSFQCRECGLCYTSPHSLARHLFIVHKQKEPRELARRNGTSATDENQMDPGSGDRIDDGMPETKCKVCGKMFETEGSLNTHMRTHGMAFIKSKRLNATEK